MAKKIEIEKPVVSPELATAFENAKDYYCKNISEIINSIKNFYTTEIPEYEKVHDLGYFVDFEELLMKMYVLGYEIEKPKRYVLELPDLDEDNEVLLVSKFKTSVAHYCTLDRNIKYINLFSYSEGFTKEEIEEDEKLSKLSGCELLEVED